MLICRLLDLQYPKHVDTIGWSAVPQDQSLYSPQSAVQDTAKSYRGGLTLLLLQAFAWVGAAAISLLIIAHRKHYSVDVVIAWYVVPLVFWTMHRRWTTKRPAVEPWPHRPLIEHTRVGGSAANMAGGVEVGSPAELAEVIVTNGSGPETSKVSSLQAVAVRYSFIPRSHTFSCILAPHEAE